MGFMSEIEEQTNGRWTPSPGSVYPLLAWLQDQGYTEEVHDQELGIKRYRLTKKGEEFYKEYVKRRKELQRRIGSFWPRSFGRLWFNVHQKGAKELNEARRQLARSMASLWKTIEDSDNKQSEETLAKVTRVLKDTAENIDKIAEEMKK